MAISAARLGSLTVTSRALVSSGSVDLRGGWHDTKRPCRIERRLTVRVQVDYVTTAGKTHRKILSKTIATPNCADGAPSLGYTLTARMLGDSCPSGAWKPGQYTFVVKTTEQATKLQAIASLSWPKPGRC